MARASQLLAKKLHREKARIKVDRIVENFKGFKWVPQIKRGGRKLTPCYMKNPDGTREVSQKGIANVFGNFYNDLYSSKKPDDTGSTFKAKRIKKQIVVVMLML